MHLFLLLVVLAAPIDSVGRTTMPVTATAEPRTMDLSAPPPLAYRYRIISWRGVIPRVRWVSEFALHNIVANGDTIGRNLLLADVDRLTETVSMPDDVQLDMTRWTVRYEQTPDGRLVRGPINIPHLERREQRLTQLHHRWQSHTKPPRPPGPPHGVISNPRKS